MIGQVSQNVYDSKTGQYLFIPAGSKLVGKYDSQVVNGQSRVLVAWQRIIFPDTSFIDIGGMQGTDTAGYSGFTGKVDDHSGKLFRNAILFSLIGAGTALLQPRTALTALTPVGAMVQTPSVASQVAGQVGTNVGQAVQQQASQGVQSSPLSKSVPATCSTSSSTAIWCCRLRTARSRSRCRSWPFLLWRQIFNRARRAFPRARWPRWSASRAAAGRSRFTTTPRAARTLFNRVGPPSRPQLRSYRRPQCRPWAGPNQQRESSRSGPHARATFRFVHESARRRDHPRARVSGGGAPLRRRPDRVAVRAERV